MRDDRNGFWMGFRFGAGLFFGFVSCVAAALALWLGALHLMSHLSLDDASAQIAARLNSLTHDGPDKPAPTRGLKVDPRERDRCLKLSNGEVNALFVECLQENAAVPPAR